MRFPYEKKLGGVIMNRLKTKNKGIGRSFVAPVRTIGLEFSRLCLVILGLGLLTLNASCSLKNPSSDAKDLEPLDVNTHGWQDAKFNFTDDIIFLATETKKSILLHDFSRLNYPSSHCSVHADESENFDRKISKDTQYSLGSVEDIAGKWRILFEVKNVGDGSNTDFRIYCNIAELQGTDDLGYIALSAYILLDLSLNYEHPVPRLFDPRAPRVAESSGTSEAGSDGESSGTSEAGSDGESSGTSEAGSDDESSGGSERAKPFDPNWCEDEPLTVDELIEKIDFAIGSTYKANVGSWKVAARYRNCNPTTGCGSWKQLVIETNEGQTISRGGTINARLFTTKLEFVGDRFDRWAHMDSTCRPRNNGHDCTTFQVKDTDDSAFVFLRKSDVSANRIPLTPFSNPNVKIADSCLWGKTGGRGFNDRPHIEWEFVKYGRIY
jgi:hypothetical protein